MQNYHYARLQQSQLRNQHMVREKYNELKESSDLVTVFATYKWPFCLGFPAAYMAQTLMSFSKRLLKNGSRKRDLTHLHCENRLRQNP